ncbi:MAG: response regulator [Anaerolineae bacterium]|jgi:two-component system response regulator YesN
MSYKVFLVEDEPITRRGIRNNVDWKSAGFEFCGEAADGEMALPLIEASQPDVIITDIKMPFLDGLQLCKIIREHMPWIKIIILSGHNEFEYAQSAIKLGAIEYLLKPVSAADLQRTLQEVAVSLDREREELKKLKKLREDATVNLSLIRESFLLRLVMGGISSAEAVEQSHKLGLDIVARCYTVLVFSIELRECAQPFDYGEYQRFEKVVSDLVDSNQDILLTKKDLAELVLIIKGDSPDELQQEGEFITELIEREVSEKIACDLTVGRGSPQCRIGDIHYSFAEALAKVAKQAHISLEPDEKIDHIELMKLGQAKVRDFLLFGDVQDCDEFFDEHLQTVSEAALHSYLIKHYLLVDIILAVAQFVSDLGGDVDQLVPEIHRIDEILLDFETYDQIREMISGILSSAISLRDSQVQSERTIIIQRAKSYIDNNFANPNLSLSEVATKANFSPSYFSSVFRQETGETFRDYLSRSRIDRAKELLRTTNLKCSEIAYQSGFGDPRHFGQVFKQKVGVSPQQFRDQNQTQKE